MRFVSLISIIDAAQGELSQTGNLNATARLILLPQHGQVAKIYTKRKELWYKNISNLSKICQLISPNDFPEIVFPIAFIEYLNETVGYLMPFIDGNTLDEVLTSKCRTTKEILLTFSQIASVLNRLPNEIHVGDIHPNNILVDHTGNMHLIDLDGFSLDNGYLMTCPLYFDDECFKVLPLEKYFKADHSIKIGKNTDIYCLMRMFFTWLLDGFNPFQFSKHRFSLFCEYLRKKELPESAVEAVAQVRKQENNYLSPDFFLCFEPLLASFSFSDFLSVMGLVKDENMHCEYIDQIIEENRDGTKIL